MPFDAGHAQPKVMTSGNGPAEERQRFHGLKNSQKDAMPRTGMTST